MWRIITFWIGSIRRRNRRIRFLARYVRVRIRVRAPSGVTFRECRRVLVTRRSSILIQAPASPCFSLFVCPISYSVYTTILLFGIDYRRDGSRDQNFKSTQPE